MEFTPYANVKTSQNETLVLVPLADLRRLEEFERQTKQSSSCAHPEEDSTYTEFLDDIRICKCGVILQMGSTAEEWKPIDAVALEAAILERISGAMDEVDNALSALNVDSVKWLITWAYEQDNHNPVLVEKRRIERERARKLYEERAAGRK